LLDSQCDRLSARFDQTLNVIKDAFQAHKIFVVRGTLFDGGPDHYAGSKRGSWFFGCFFHAGKAAPQIRCYRPRPRTLRVVFARQLGVSRSSASREAGAPGTRILVAELLEPHRERPNELFEKMLDVIKVPFQARKIFLVRGVLVDDGRDHYARLEAGELVLRCEALRHREWL